MAAIDPIKWAEGLIAQLPETHDGRNSWLLNHGAEPEADRVRRVYYEKTGTFLPNPAASPPAPVERRTGERERRNHNHGIGGRSGTWPAIRLSGAPDCRRASPAPNSSEE